MDALHFAVLAILVLCLVWFVRFGFTIVCLGLLAYWFFHPFF